MIDLAQHIEKLLAENECVIIPHFGGFITYYAPARWEEESGLFLPPARMIRFNPRLTLNDGLLIQSYMKTYGMSYAEASRRVQAEVRQWISRLHEEGTIELPRIGQLSLTLRQTFDFAPCAQQAPSSEWYGLSGFKMPKLATPRPQLAPRHVAPRSVEKAPRRFRIRFNAPLWSNIAAVAAIIILFFAISIPVKNTEIIHGNYAQLMPTEVFRQLDKQSLAIIPLAASSLPKEKSAGKVKKEAPPKAVPATDTVRTATPAPQRPQTTSTPRAIETATVTPKPAKAATPAPKPQSHASASADKAKIYHIIVASVGTQADAEKMASELVRAGYKEAKAIIGSGKMRVSIQSYASQAEAYQAVNQLRKEKAYQNAWVLKKK